MIMDRKYSVKEIDRMRCAVENIISIMDIGRPDDSNVEDRLRTYMINGTDPEELEAESEEKLHAYWKRVESEK